MDEDEVAARIAVLEALVFGLIEKEAYEAFRAAGEDGLKALTARYGELVVTRLDGMPKQQESFGREHFRTFFDLLGARMSPSQSGAKVN